MTIEELKIDVCMTAVNVVVKTMRDFGAVCENCKHYKKNANAVDVCAPDGHQVLPTDFCQSFVFANYKVCKPLYETLLERYKDEIV